VAAGSDGGSGGVGADGVVAGAAVAADAAVMAASALLLESHSAAYVWSGQLQARPVSSIQPSVDERWVDARWLVRWAGRSGLPVGPDSA
jgi:hypothetical protein